MRTAYSVLRIGALSGASFGAYCVLRTAYCVFEALSGANFEAYCVLRIAYCVFEALSGAGFGAYCVLRTAYCVLRIPYCAFWRNVLNLQGYLVRQK